MNSMTKVKMQVDLTKDITSHVLLGLMIKIVKVDDRIYSMGIYLIIILIVSTKVTLLWYVL